MKVAPMIVALLALASGRAYADEFLNSPGPPGALLNGSLDHPIAGELNGSLSNSDFGRLEEDAVLASVYSRSRAQHFWGGGSVPVWRAGGVAGAIGSGALLGSLAKGPGGVPVLQLGVIRGTSGLVVRSR